MKKLRKVLTIIIVFSMMTSFAYVPQAKAASLTDVKDTVSTSAPGVAATHTVDFTTGVGLTDLGYVEVTFDGSFGPIVANGDITCGAGGTATGEGTNVARCTYTPSYATGTKQIIVENITNPTTGFYDVDIATYLAGGSMQENAKVIVAIVDTVTVTAHVDSALTFAVAGVNAGVTINGYATTGTSTASTTPFGDLDPLHVGPYVIGQQLQVTTNASEGFVVTVTQNSNFQTAAGAIIDSFVMGTPATTPTPWTSPVPDIDLANTWGHFGITTDDNDGVSGLAVYGSQEYTGLEVGTSTTVMAHDGPSSATAEDRGLTNVAYAVEISALQEAGDYSTTLTYIATPTF